MIYDELWELWKDYPMENSRLLPTFDILAFYVDPRLGQSGFSPHRDRQPFDVSSSFFPDGLPKYVTRWIAIEDADAESNSCLYVIPKQHDPGYLAGDDDEEEEEEGGGVEDGDDVEKVDCSDAVASSSSTNIDGGKNPSILPLQRALSTKESYQYIRALPIPSGSSLVFSHRIIHWGSSGNPKTTRKPRIAISFTYSSPDFEKPYLEESAFDCSSENAPPFKVRLLLCCCQMLIYYQRFGLERDGVMSCYEYVKEHGERILEEGYMKKVLREFVLAVKEGGEGGDNDSEVNESDEERMLEEMLDQADEFEDDYEHDEGDFDEEEGEGGEGENDFEDEFDDNELGEGPLDGSFPKRKRRKTTLDDHEDEA